MMMMKSGDTLLFLLKDCLNDISLLVNLPA